MESKVLVERVRDLNDRRSVLIRLTPHGREVVDRLLSLNLAFAAHMLEPLDTTQREQLANMLRILLESFGDNTL
jgi:DNA-binding MarR family transcriptional regulator